MAEIIIDLDKVNSPTTYTEKNEVFQHESIANINMVFEKLLDFDNKDKKDIHKVRRHDTIFIDGVRGSGKTAFLLNIENQLDKQHKKNCKFFNPIDPTLLEKSENFLGVILGLIVKEIEQSGCTSKSDQYGMRDYYDSLEKLSKSLGSIKTVSESIGIDEIADFRSSNALENDTHNFFYAVCRLFEVKTLVLLIDDIDMAFTKGFDVLETIRKTLASPYIIPVVSGDGKLYKKLIRNHFEREISCNNNCIEIDENNPNKELIAQSVDQYFNKVMPNDNRIELKDIFTILKENEVSIKIDDNKSIPYIKLKDFEIGLINSGINQIQFRKNVFKKNTRSFVQYLAKKREVFKEIDWDNIDNNNLSNSLEDKTYQRSLELTQSFYHFSSDYKKQQLSKMLKNDIQAFKDKKINSYQVFLGDFFQNEKNREHNYLKLEKEVLNEKLFIVKDGLIKYLKDKNNENTIEYIIPRLFTHDDYYSSSSSTRFHFFTGKFIEFMMFSLSHDFEDKDTIQMINNIINNKPYNMHFHSNNYLEEVDDESTNTEHIYPKEIQSEKFLGELKEWSKKIGSHYFTTIQLHEILNKFFNNINVLKGESLVENTTTTKSGLNINKLIQNNTPWQVFQRVVIIFINAVASLEKKGQISNSNIATSLNTFEWKDLENTSQTYRDNIKLLKEEEKSLVSILFQHPIIEFILSNKRGEFQFLKQEKVTKTKPSYMRHREEFFKNKEEITTLNANRFYESILNSAEYLEQYAKRLKYKSNNYEKIVEEKRIK